MKIKLPAVVLIPLLWLNQLKAQLPVSGVDKLFLIMQKDNSS